MTIIITVMRYLDGTMEVLEKQIERQHFDYSSRIFTISFCILSNKIIYLSTRFSPVRSKLHVVVQVIYVLPAVDVNSSVRGDHQHHESQLGEVADLHQHGGCDERHHGHEAVMLRVVRAASRPE